MNRRSFLKSVGVAAAVVCLPVPMAKADEYFWQPDQYGPCRKRITGMEILQRQKIGAAKWQQIQKHIGPKN